HRAMALVEPAAPLALPQKAPDVLDVRVREGVVVVVPVHPHPEPPGLVRDHLGVLRHALLAALRELGEPVLLDLALRVQAEVALTQLVERPLALPRLEDLELERDVVRDARERLEGPVRHAGDPSEGRSARFGAFSTG